MKYWQSLLIFLWIVCCNVCGKADEGNIEIITLNLNKSYKKQKLVSYFGNQIYLMSESNIFSFDYQGQLMWKKNFADRVIHKERRSQRNFIVSNENEVLVTYNQSEHTIAKLFDKNGNLIWQKKLLNFTRTSPIINEKFVIISTIGKIYALDIQNGKIIWQKDFMNKIKNFSQNSPTFFDKETFLFNNHVDKIIKINLTNNEDYIETTIDFKSIKTPIMINNDDILLYNNTAIYIINKNLDIKKTLYIENPEEIRKIKISNKQIFLLTNKNCIKILSNDLQEIGQIKSAQITDFFLSKEKLFLIKKSLVEIYDLNSQSLEKKIIAKNIINIAENSDEYLLYQSN